MIPHQCLRKTFQGSYDTSNFLFKRNTNTSVNNKNWTVSAPYDIWETNDKMTVSTSVSRTQ